jgi:YD repeat-containing protein
LVTFTRDGSGRIRTITDPKGNVYLYEYDATGDLTRTVDPTLAETTYSYDDRHNLLEIVDRGATARCGASTTTTAVWSRP